MNARSTHTRYGTVAVGFHWASAALVVGQLLLGLAMTRVNDGNNDGMYRIHVGLGMMIAALTLGRLVWRLFEPSPDHPPMPRWRLVLYQANHAAFYVILLALTGIGLALLISSDMTPLPTSVEAASVEDGRLRDGHFRLAIVFSALFVMHVAGVVSYQRSKGDVFARMGVNGLPSPDASHTPVEVEESS